jgi:hypothetical protein
MPPRRRTFYLADATLLSNPKVIRLRSRHPDQWLAVLGGFHVLIGVATLNGSPRLSQDEISDVLGGDGSLTGLLREAGLLTRTGIDKGTFEEWCPKARPEYPSDRKRRKGSDGDDDDSDGVGRDSAVVGDNSAESGGVPTSTTTSPSSSKAASSSPSRGVGHSAGKKNDGLSTPPTKEERLLALSEDYKANRITELEYERQRKALRGAA